MAAVSIRCSLALLVLLATGFTAHAQDSAPDIDRLAQDLSSDDVNERRDAAYELKQLGPRAKAAVPALTRALEDRDPQVWFESIQALARIGPEAAEADR